ncbi:DNA polymerase III subunit beta [Desulfacinum hydrothermale]|nr:DNA polymerase III subunit beta [Desulfacinum hydrothermale]
MKFEIPKKDLLSVVGKLVGITNEKTVHPILNGVLIDIADEQQVYLTATDLEISLRAKVEAQVSVSGGVVVPARKFLDVVKMLPGKTVSCRLVDNQLKVASGKTQYKIATWPAEDFPNVSIELPDSMIDVEVESLKRILSRTVCSVASDKDCFDNVLAGVYLHSPGIDGLRVVGCDGHRLSYDQIDDFPALQLLGEQEGIIVPKKGIRETLRLLENADQVSLGLLENRLCIQVPNALLSMQLLEGNYPQYEHVIPDHTTSIMVDVERQVLLGALRRMAVVTDQVHKSIRMTVCSDLLCLEAGTENPMTGTAREEIPASYTGEEFKMTYNINYVMETLQNMQTDNVRIHWVDKNHGGLFLEPDNHNYLTMIMPMNE